MAYAGYTHAALHLLQVAGMRRRLQHLTRASDLEEVRPLLETADVEVLDAFLLIIKYHPDTNAAQLQNTTARASLVNLDLGGFDLPS